jgi:hypothetical protein
MRHTFIAGTVTAMLLFGSAAVAQDSPTPIPPPNALKLSELVAKVEQRDAFQYVADIEWNDDGYYEVTYFTQDKAKVEIRFNPVTGEPQ